MKKTIQSGVSMKKEFADPHDLLNVLQQDSPYWKVTGRFLYAESDGTKNFELAPGLFRFESPGGQIGFSGLLLNGLQVQVGIQGQNQYWKLDEDFAKRRLGQAARQAASFTQSESRKINREEVEVRRYTPSSDGAQWYAIRFSKAHSGLQVFSDAPLKEEALFNIAQVISDAPACTFTRIQALFVFESIGAVRSPDGKLYPTRGNAVTDDLLVSRQFLTALDSARTLLNHEVAHVLDRYWGDEKRWLSDIAQDEAGRLLFGNGNFVGSPSPPLIASIVESEFVSEYARMDPKEDFAETHQFLLNLRRIVQAESGEKDFFLLPSEELEARLRYYSHRLRQKLHCLVNAYRSTLSNPPTPGQESRFF